MYNTWMACGGITFTPFVVKIGRMVGSLREGCRQELMASQRGFRK